MAACVVRHGELRRPGFAGLAPELAAPFAEWAEARGLSTAASLLEPWFTTFGYGYIDEIPAAYALKYAALFGPAFELLDGGYQELWTRVAKTLDVELGVVVRRVRRDGDEVVVDLAEPGRAPLRFDALILACPLDDALGFLDATPEERDLFSRIRWQDYRVVVADVKGLCDARYLFFPKHFHQDARRRPMFAYKRWPDRDVRLFYAFGDAEAPPGAVEANVSEMVRAAGGSVTRVHRVEAWRYFPHVGTADLSAGFYDRVEALQGKRHTYYAGELLSFGTVENVVAYSRALVDRFFAGRARREPRAGGLFVVARGA
jgi:predicted NAD/FAD-binding protein